jgi:hypothetical protein
MSSPLERIFAEIADYNKEIAGLHGDTLSILRRDVERFLEKTDSSCTQMQWQGVAVVALTFLSGSLAVFGALYPKNTPNAPSAASPAVDVRLNANAGLGDSASDWFRWFGEKMNDNDFLRSTCKTASKTFSGITPAVDAYFRSTTTEIEAKRSLLERINIQDAQQQKSTLSQLSQQAQQAIQRILDSKTKGG